MKLANQPDSLPSNKLLAMSVVTLAFHYTADTILPPEVLEAWGVLIQVGLAFVAAYMVPDRANVPR